MLLLLLLLTLELLLLLPCTPVLFPPQLSTDMLDTTMASARLTLMLMLTPSDRSLLVFPSTMPMLLDTPTMLELSPEPPTPPLSTTDTPPMLPLHIPMLPMDTLVFMLMLPQLFMDMQDTTMASVRLMLMLMLTPLDRSLLLPTPPLSTTDTLPMLPLPILDMLDILAMLVWDMLVLAILVLTTGKHIH